MEAAFLIPNKGLMVRDPKTKDVLSPDGEVKPMIGPEGRYWRRRVKDGAVKIGKMPFVKKTAKQKTKELK